MAATAFDRLLELGDKINHNHNGETAVFAYNNITETSDISVIFESSKEIISIQGETEVVTRRPVAYIKIKQIEDLAIPIPAVKDQLTVQGTVYDIVAVLDDGHNEIEIHLEKE